MQIMHNINLFMFFCGILSKHSAGDLKDYHCGQNKLVKICVMVFYIKITFLRLILN